MSIFVYIEGVLFVQNGKEEQPAVKSGLRLDKLDAQNQQIWWNTRNNWKWL